jgi:hypothetical protein
MVAAIIRMAAFTANRLWTHVSPAGHHTREAHALSAP